MGDETKRIKLLVESRTRSNGPISALFVAGIFQRLQNILYYIIDELEGNTTRKAGDFPNSVKEKAELVIIGMHIGSVEAELMISDSQMGLPGSTTYGEKALLIADKILIDVSQEKDIGQALLKTMKMALEKGGKYALRLVNEKSIEDLKLLSLDKIRMKGRSLNLKEPILLEVIYEDDQYWVSNDKFHLRGYGSTLKAAIEDLNEEIEILWEDYVETGLEQLSRDAMDFRLELVASFGGEKSNANI